MFAVRQIIEDPADVIAVPAEMRHRRTEVIFIAMDDAPPQPYPLTTGGGKWSGSEARDQNSEILKFWGAIPDFPDCDPQGECDVREDVA